ncbi:unnamed protein product [Closterium sp. NIES-54]
MGHFILTHTTARTEETAQLFLKHIISQHGIPTTLISDRDPKFTSKFWKELMSIMGTCLAMSSAYHPQTDGQTERLNQIVEQLLRAACKDDINKWDLLLPVLETTLAALCFAPSAADPSLFLRTDTSLPPFYIPVYVDNLVFATAETEALALVKAELQERHSCTDVLQRFDFSWSSPQSTSQSTGHSLSTPPSDESVHPSGPYPELVGCLIFSLGAGSVSWRSTRSSSVLSSGYEAEIYVGAMGAQELRWLTYLLTDLGERPRSPPVLYVDNKVMIALCDDQRLEHRTKHIALCYFLTQELQQCGQLRLAYVATQANTSDVFTKALGSGDHQRFCTALGLVPTLPHLLVS